MSISGKLLSGKTDLALALLLLLVTGPWIPASPSRITELEQSLAAAGPAEKPALLVQLSAAIEAEDMNRSWEYAQQARQSALLPTDQIKADTRLAILQRRRGNYAEAMALAEAALPAAENLGEATLRGELLLVIAHTHVSLANFTAALDLFRVLIPLAEEIGDASFLSRVHSTLGIAYADAEQIDRAKSAYGTALAYAEKAGNRRMISSLLNNLGNTAMETGDAPLARQYHERALTLRLADGGDARGVADSNQNLAHVSLMEEKPAEAIPYLDRAIPLYVSLGLKRNLANAQIAYVNALSALGRLDEVPARLGAARQLAEELNSPTILVRAYRAAAEFHEARGDLRAALDAERLLAVATDRAIGEKSRQRLDALQAQFDAERRQHEIDVLRRDQAVKEAELARVRAQRYGLVALVILAGIAIAALVSRQRFKRRAEERILTETRAARDAAQQADALKTRLLGMVSHDIRGPAGNILSLSEDLRDESPANAADQRVQLILHESQHVLDLAQDLLDAAALESGRLHIESAPVDLNDIVHATVGRMSVNAAAKSQRIEFVAAGGFGSIVLGDAKRLAQITTNLLSNALKFSPARSTVRLAIRRNGDRVLLAVADEGPGIPAESIPLLFRPFSQLPIRPTGNESSHGLGLSIVHDLVRLQGGQVSVETAPGRGTTFTIDLPAHH